MIVDGTVAALFALERFTTVFALTVAESVTRPEELAGPITLFGVSVTLLTAVLLAIVKMPDALVVDWPSGLVMVTVWAPVEAFEATDIFSVT